MAVNFKSRTSWHKNDLLLPPGYFGVSVPRGVDDFDVRFPNFVDYPTMMRLAPSSTRPTSNLLLIVNGLVTAELTIVFADPAQQWRKSSPWSASGAQPHGPWRFEFTGGDVFLDLKMGIFLWDALDFDPKDNLAVQIFALIYDHELLHVLDAIDIVTRWLPPHLLAEPTVARYLVQGEPFDYGFARSTAMEQDFADFIAKFIITAISNFWLTEKNRRGGLRDAPAQYQIVQDKVNALERKRINRPPPKKP